jgi:hypothetical protein
MRPALRLGVFALVLASSPCPLPASAASLAVDGSFAATNDPDGQDLVNLTATQGTLTGTVSAAGVSGTGSGEAAGQATASAEYGRLRAQAGGAAFGPFPEFGGGVATGSIQASWSDVLVIQTGNPSLLNQLGSLLFQIQLSGSLFADAGGADLSNTRASYSVRVESAFCGTVCSTERFGERDDFGSQGGAAISQGDPIATFTGTPLDFLFGVPFDLNVFLSASAQAVAGVASFTSTASADLGSTLEWGGILELRDGAGNLVTDYAVTSESGTDWSQPVPEPATVVLVAMGLLPLATAARRGVPRRAAALARSAATASARLDRAA